MTQRLAVRRPTRRPAEDRCWYSCTQRPCSQQRTCAGSTPATGTSMPSRRCPGRWACRSLCPGPPASSEGPLGAAQQPAQDDMTPKRQTSLDVLIMPALSRQAEADCRCVSSELRCGLGGPPPTTLVRSSQFRPARYGGGGRPAAGGHLLPIVGPGLLASVRQREAPGGTIIDFPGIRWHFAEAAAEIDAARLLSYQAAASYVDSGSAAAPRW